MIGKIFGAGLGWVLGGPIGAAIGIAIGSTIDNSGVKRKTIASGRPSTQQGDFNMALLVLSAAVMKADGKVLKSELNFVKDFLHKSFGETLGQEQVTILREVLKQDLDINAIAGQIRSSMRINEKRLLLQYLFGIAQADGHIDQSELNLLQRIAIQMGISNAEFSSMQAMFAGKGSSVNDYKVLEVEENISNEDLKKTYRKLVVKHHPDKVSHLGEDHIKSANEKFQKIQVAYSNIKKARGL